MKKLKLIIIILFLFITGCSQSKVPEDNQTKNQEAAVTEQTEPLSQALSEGEKFNQVCMVSFKVGFALVDDGRVLETLDGGKTWIDFYTIKESEDRMGVGSTMYAVDEHTLYIVAYYDGGTNFISTKDGGKNWETAALDSKLNWLKDDISGYNMSFTDADNGYIMINSTPGAGQMLKALYNTTDGGTSWVMITGDAGGEDDVLGVTPVGVGGFPNGMAFSDVKNGWIMCSSYGPYGVYFYKTDNGGKTWSMTDIPEFPSEYLNYDESDLYITALSPSFYGKAGKKGKMVMVFATYTENINETAYIYNLSTQGNWELEGKSDTLINNYKFIDDNNGFGLDETENLRKTEDGGLTWIIP